MRQKIELARATSSQASRSAGGRAKARMPSASSNRGSMAETTFFVISTVRPYVVAGRGIDQLGCDAHAIAGSANAALQDVAHAQLAGGALHVDRLGLVSER